MNEEKTEPMEIVSSDALQAIERAQIDVQIETAKRYPRSIRQFMDTARSMIAQDPEIAEECNYILKRREKDGTQKFIEGPSIRLLEIAACGFQNLRYGSRILGEDQTSVTCQGVAHDLQNNVAISVEVKRRITTKAGQRYSDDMVNTTAMAGGAIARRNALAGVIPRVYINQLANYAKDISKGDIKSLPERRQKAFDYFVKVLGIEQPRVLGFLERASLEEVTVDDLMKLTGLKTALRDKETTLDEAFPLTPTKPIFEAAKPIEKPQATDEPELQEMGLAPKPEPRKLTPDELREAAKVYHPPPAPPPQPEPTTEEIVTEAVVSWGYTWDQFADYLVETKIDVNAKSLPGFADLDWRRCKRLGIPSNLRAVRAWMDAKYAKQEQTLAAEELTADELAELRGEFNDGR